MPPRPRKRAAVVESDTSSDEDDESSSSPSTPPPGSKLSTKGKKASAPAPIVARTKISILSPAKARKSSNAASSGGGGRRASLSQSLTDNDDSAERLERRRAAAATAPDSPGGAGKKRGNGLLGAAVAGASRASAANRRLSAIVQPQGGDPDKPVETLEAMSMKFDRTMKLVTDNKINSNNTWEFALIDYFADMTLLRNGPNDQSINFQKASCTLDGCVKIWTSRVDSVASETGKLLSGLSESRLDDNEGGEDEGEDGEGGEDGEDGGKRKKRASNKTATLAPSFASLATKKLDLEATVDPLFKKTCADFDEGGATGLLMNGLGVDRDGKLVFDASGSSLGDGEDDDEDEYEYGEGEDEDMDEATKKKKRSRTVDVSALKAKFLPGDLPALLSRPISSSLSTFAFSSDPATALDFDLALLSAAAAAAAASVKPPPQEDDRDVANPSDAGGGGIDFFDDDEMNDPGPDFDPSAGGGYYNPDDDHNGDDDGEGGGPRGGSSRSGQLEAFNPMRAPNERDLVMAMVASSAGGEDGQGDLFDYFDRELLGKNWAGPEHWKMKRRVAFPSKLEPGSASAAAKSTKSKPPFAIDFLCPAPPIPSAQLFEPASGRLSLLPKAAAAPGGKRKLGAGGRKPSSSAAQKEKERQKEREKYLLPDDLHFSSAQLLRLFMKKTFTLRMRKQDSDRLDADGGEVDPSFWADAPGRAAGQEAVDPSLVDGNLIPFETQFFHDADSDYGGNDGQDDFGPGPSDDFLSPLEDDPTAAVPKEEEESLWAGTQNLKRTRPDYVKYTKRAKRVDVKRLKDSIWKGLGIRAPALEGHEEDEPEPELDIANDEDPTIPREFSSVVRSLQGDYAPDKMADISTSYCFICLLHLCNERGLQIERPEGVGPLKDLRISKDLDAKGHA